MIKVNYFLLSIWVLLFIFSIWILFTSWWFTGLTMFLFVIIWIVIEIFEVIK